MKHKKYISDGNNKLKDGSYLYTYNTGLITISYTKQKELVFIIQDISSSQIIPVKKELKEKGFKELSETAAEEFGPGTIGSKWGKTGYPYRFVLYNRKDTISLLSLQTDKYAD